MARKATKLREEPVSERQAIRPPVHNVVAPERARLVSAYADALGAYRNVEKANSPDALQELVARQDDVRAYIQKLHEPMRTKVLQTMQGITDHKKTGELADHFNYLMRVVSAIQDDSIWKQQSIKT